ncbi:nitroreductase family deazaflavin-dependent oxidoreductase [Nocardiopsis sp. YSL2]|uniref:nitroreductase family deazaflavin-dependent oxidoreductase n=1 Tax=Nocardiopsis sp. YSL2 TaxID=2939492 RepID=UPI0026F40DAD|nr:nitroreductase family deazaflavin-dependent oxidoreductase [Nocardiopsis sp. YSL2]
MPMSRPPTTPMRRALFRAPIWIYRLGLGPLMGRRFVLLTHRGRTSGTARQAVLEVVGANESTGTVLVASGYGRRSQWYRNILAEPRVLFQLGAHRHRGRAAPLPPEEAGQALAHYAQRHPAAAWTLLGALGFEVDGSAESFARVGADPDGVPIVRLAPTDPPRSDFPDLSER